MHIDANVRSIEKLKDFYFVSRATLGYSFDTWDRSQIERRQWVLMELAFRTWTLCGERLDARVEHA